MKCSRAHDQLSLSEIKTTHISLPNGGLHIKAVCPECGFFIKFLSLKEKKCLSDLRKPAHIKIVPEFKPKVYKNYSNESECLFAKDYAGKGWHITKWGRPDFICIRKKEVMFVEVKPDNEMKLRKSQNTTIKILRKHGLPCYIWTPSHGLVPFEDYGA